MPAGNVSITANYGEIWDQHGSTIAGSASGAFLGELVAMGGDGTVMSAGDYADSKVKVYKDVGGTWTSIGEFSQPTVHQHWW